MPFDENQERDDKGMWTSGDAGDAIKDAASDKKRKKFKLSDVEKIKPEQFYKYEYLSKIHNQWVPLKKTDSAVSLYKSGYDIKTKDLYTYTL